MTLKGPSDGEIEFITGGGAAASVAITGAFRLVGSYEVDGAVTIGSQTELQRLQSSEAAPTSDSLLISAGDTIFAGSVDLIDGKITVETGGLLSTSGGLSIDEGNLDIHGTVSIGGTLTIGKASQFSFERPLANQLNVERGGNLAVTGGITAENGGVFLIGSKLSAGGTLTVAGVPSKAEYWDFEVDPSVYYGGHYYDWIVDIHHLGLAAVLDAYAQFDGLVLKANGYRENITADKSSRIVIGSSVGAQGAITIDAGKTITAAGSPTLFNCLMVNDGTLDISSGAVAQIGYGTASGGWLGDVDESSHWAQVEVFEGPISGSGIVRIGEDATLIANGGIAASETIAFVGTGGTLSVGSSDNDDRWDRFMSREYTPWDLSATITGFQPGDSILLAQPTSQAVDAATYTAPTGADLGALVLSNGTTTLQTLHFAGDFTGKDFSVSERVDYWPGSRTNCSCTITLIDQTTPGSHTSVLFASTSTTHVIP